MSLSGRRETRNSSEYRDDNNDDNNDDDADLCSWTHVVLESGGGGIELGRVTDRTRTILYDRDSDRFRSDRDVELDVGVNSEAIDEHNCLPSGSSSAHRFSVAATQNGDISSGLQESISTASTGNNYYTRTSGETVMLTSRGAPSSSWSNVVVQPVDRQRTTAPPVSLGVHMSVTFKLK